jgi:hypothetical protein
METNEEREGHGDSDGCVIKADGLRGSEPSTDAEPERT